jgi:hypothetical protein
MQRKFRANASRIDRVMDELSVSAEAIGRAAGHADGSYIRRMRRGDKRAQKATLKTAEAVCRMLGSLPLDYLFTEVDPRTGHDLVMTADSKTTGSEALAS